MREIIIVAEVKHWAMKIKFEIRTTKKVKEGEMVPLYVRMVDGRAFHQTVKTRTRKEEKVPINTIACSHMARRTFIGNIYKLVQDPNLISALTGHVEGSRAFSRYRTIDMDMKKDLVKILDLT